MRVADKVAIITGAGSGIGEATAKLFAREGAKVVVADVHRENGERVAHDIVAGGGEAVFIPVDVTNWAQVEAMVEQALATFGRIDILFNNAGIGCVGMLHEIDEAVWDQVMAVNVKGVYLVAKAVVPHMMAQRSGVIINMSSCIATTGLALRAGYAASKGAVYSLTKSMQVDYAPYGIRVNALLPGTIYTPFVENYLRHSYADPEEALAAIKKRQLTGELGTPEDVAYAALYLASDEAKFVYGAGLVVDGGVTAGK
ncbi:SDR family NAD(P)-dependent oxidoreductase [Alicyclobacillus cellulosilyticus]|uniref:SDR family NAD(P)-dependent oxidoreductase n=1 Tax=Alicyclobacillus cellulosilyticus TaxID=1003997 RepID=UPI0016648762|nr:glucose 1-dehydrogenase [Alicyclobacillus cellulosilyticus]